MRQREGRVGGEPTTPTEETHRPAPWPGLACTAARCDTGAAVWPHTLAASVGTALLLLLLLLPARAAAARLCSENAIFLCLGTERD